MGTRSKSIQLLLAAALFGALFLSPPAFAVDSYNMKMDEKNAR